MNMYMRIATESPLKKLLVGGLEKVYELGRIFRNEGLSPKHNPEFTSVEIYQAYGDLRDMMALTENAVSKLAQDLTGGTTVTFRGRQIKLGAPWPRLDYCELLKQHAGVSYEDIPGLEKKCREKGIDPSGLSHVDKIDSVFGEYCEPHLMDACFIINQPVEMSPLCRAHPNNPKLADRFEAFASGMEIANAYTELNDPIEQRTRLVQQAKDASVNALAALNKAGLEEFIKVSASDEWVDKAKAAIAAIPAKHPKKAALEEIAKNVHAADQRIDEDFLTAMEHAMPPAGGLGIGVDRVVMLLAGADSIRDVILFPLMRPQHEKPAEEKAAEDSSKK
jgi:lysyl-tRNA synthetase class 2